MALQGMAARNDAAYFAAKGPAAVQWAARWKQAKAPTRNWAVSSHTGAPQQTASAAELKLSDDLTREGVAAGYIPPPTNKSSGLIGIADRATNLAVKGAVVGGLVVGTAGVAGVGPAAAAPAGAAATTGAASSTLGVGMTAEAGAAAYTGQIAAAKAAAAGTTTAAGAGTGISLAKAGAFAKEAATGLAAASLLSAKGSAAEVSAPITEDDIVIEPAKDPNAGDRSTAHGMARDALARRASAAGTTRSDNEADLLGYTTPKARRRGAARQALVG